MEIIWKWITQSVENKFMTGYIVQMQIYMYLFAWKFFNMVSVFYGEQACGIVFVVFKTSNWDPGPLKCIF